MTPKRQRHWHWRAIKERFSAGLYGPPIETHRFSWQRATVVLLIYLRIANSGSWKCG
jgi:hypothetical protein